ncbi:MAG: RNA methyltransferase [Ferruginibacter sp.]|nr:RNA methyltransferase [Ferruginibacter sp.]
MISKSTVKYIQSLHQKKYRDEHNAFIAEGPKVATEFLETNIFECDAIYCTKNGYTILNSSITNKYAAKINIIEEYELEKITALKVANNLLVVLQKKIDSNNINIANKLTLVLDDIQDPGNLGTIIRNADWFGVETIFCSPATADCYNPKVVQSTMASLGRVNIVYGDIANLLLQNKNIASYAAVLDGNDIKHSQKISEGFIIIGNESKGISTSVLNMVTHKISIAKIGTAESLNAAVASGIILYQLT